MPDQGGSESLLPRHALKVPTPMYRHASQQTYTRRHRILYPRLQVVPPPEQHRIRAAGLREIDKAGYPGKGCPRAEPFNNWGYFCPLEVARKWKLSFKFSQKWERTAYGVSKNKKCQCETVPDAHLVGCVASREKWCLGIICFLRLPV